MQKSDLPVTPGSGLSGAGGAILVLLFFVPWFSACGVNMSGYDLAVGIDMGAFGRGPAAYPMLIFLPLAGIASVILAFLNFRKPVEDTRRRAWISIISGGAACLLMGGVLFGYLSESGKQLIEVEFGFPLSILAAIGMLAGGIWDARPPGEVSNRRSDRGRHADGGEPAAPPYGSMAAGTYRPPPMSPPAPRRPRAWIQGRRGDFTGRSLEIRGDAIGLGRGRENEVHISQEAVSRQHATIAYSNGQYYLQDRSRTGTLVNGQRVATTPLHDGDTIQIGDSVFVFRVLQQ